MYMCTLTPLFFFSFPRPPPIPAFVGGSIFVVYGGGHYFFYLHAAVEKRPFQVLGRERVAKYRHLGRDDTRLQVPHVRFDAEGYQDENMKYTQR